jgi:hypothetical protein
VTLVCAWILCTVQPETLSPGAVRSVNSPTMATQQTSPSDRIPIPVTAKSAADSPAQIKYQTVHYVASRGPRRSVDLNSRVKNFGNDVTVRYFTPRTVVIQTAGDSEVHEVSDDVTVRYFKQKNTGSQAESATGGSPHTATR